MGEESLSGVDEERYLELQKELALKMDSVADERDVAEINRIVTEMEEMKPIPFMPSVDDAKKHFWKNIFPQIMADRTDFKWLMHNINDKQNRKEAPAHGYMRAPRYGFAALVFIVSFCLFSTFALAAFGFLDPIISWTQETIIKSNATSQLHGEYQSYIHSNVDFDAIELNHSIIIQRPKFLPEGITESSMTTSQAYAYTMYQISYEGDHTIQYDIYVREPMYEYRHHIEYINNTVREYHTGGIVYYIYQNYNWYGATWDYGNVDCNVYGFQSATDVEKFLDNLAF